jgi:hypothetical protein
MKLIRRRRPRNVNLATTSRLQHIEPELLAIILSFLVDTGEDYSTSSDAVILSRALALCTVGWVCRSWQAVSQDFLYEHLRPQTLNALIQLHKLIREKNGLAQRVKSLSPPIFEEWSVNSSFDYDWRPLFLVLNRGRALLMSINDYYTMFRIFGELANMCPNLRHFSLPISLNGGLFVIPPEFCTGQVSQITSLTLSSLPFGRMAKGSDSSSGLRPICFPCVKKLKLVGLTRFVRDNTITDCIHTPALEHITFSQTSLTVPTLIKFIEPVKGTLNSLDIAHAFTSLNLYTESGDPFFPQTLQIFQNIKHFTVDARGSSYLLADETMLHQVPAFLSASFKPNTIRSLETLHLHVWISSTLIELDYFYPSLRVLQIDFCNPLQTTVPKNKANFRLVNYLAHFLKNKDLVAPELREITLNWTFIRIPESGFDWLACCLAYCLQKRCEKYGVRLDLKMNCSMLFCSRYDWLLNRTECEVDDFFAYVTAPYRWTRHGAKYGLHRWSKSGRFGPLSIADGALSCVQNSYRWLHRRL